MRILTSTKELTNAGVIFVINTQRTCESYVARIDCYISKENLIYYRRVAKNGAGGKLEMNSPEAIGALPYASGTRHDAWLAALINNSELAAVQRLLAEHCRSQSHHSLRTALEAAGCYPLAQ